MQPDWSHDIGGEPLDAQESLLYQMLCTEITTNQVWSIPDILEWYQAAFSMCLPLIRKQVFDHPWWFYTLRFLRAGHYGGDDIKEFLTRTHVQMLAKVIAR